ncbi:MAG: SagB/ThcOx family dehydrogenase [Kiritimatiellaeota bacterium]|nr:SagB/ThcOx family dehydrogenase [Kiritimatiellota bacterium]
MQTTIRMLAGMFVMATGLATAQELADVKLPEPKMDGGKPLMQVFKQRQSTREYSAQALTPQVLSDLLWAAHGINRTDGGKRTVPSAKNWQEMDVYVLAAEGAYLHDVKANCLKAVAKGDLRKLTGKQEFAGTVPVNLVYVADSTKMLKATPEEIAFYSATDTGVIVQNVYLFCTSEGLATVVRMPSDKPTLAAALKLSDTAKITLAQSVGYPAAPKKP